MSSLYQSGWNPRGVRKDWDRTSMDVPSTIKVLGHWAEMLGGTITDAVAWFDFDGACRILVVDSDNGKRLDQRRNNRGHTTTISRRPVAQTADDQRVGEPQAKSEPPQNPVQP